MAPSWFLFLIIAPSPLFRVEILLDETEKKLSQWVWTLKVLSELAGKEFDTNLSHPPQLNLSLRSY